MSDPEGDLSDEETEILVYVECEGYVNSSTFKSENLSLDIVGIDSEHPIMQINGKFYEGTYRDAVGTYMFFDKDDSPVVDDPVFDTPPTLKYFTKTRKLLKMERVFAMQRTEVLGDLDHTYCIPNIETIKEAGVPAKYQNDALEFWNKMRDDRMQALTSYLEKEEMKEKKRSQGIQVDSESDEDNPFAMYKPRESRDTRRDTGSEIENVSETEEHEISNMLDSIMELNSNTDSTKKIPRKPAKKLTVIDPGPSTSKRNDPDMPSLSLKKRRKPAVRVISKPKMKDVFKKPNKRAPKSKKSLKLAPFNEDSKSGVEIESAESRTEPIITGPATEEAENDKDLATVDETSSSSKNVCPITKKLEKQAKRDAKMKEISERLKTQKDELEQKKNPS